MYATFVHLWSPWNFARIFQTRTPRRSTARQLLILYNSMILQSNPQLELAFDYVCNTNKNIFLTGKAGTGKTTFLERLKAEPVKRMAVVAPTGVAAINAGGMTIHSFFQLPFGPFLPGSARDAARMRKFSGEKIRLIQSLDLLVIDEISMVRADLLDGIDEVLRRYRDHYQPFGGVQLLMIGDLHQLPPVVKDEEWYLLREHYPTPYFFSSQALQRSQPVVIELKHIYRQSDDTFIQLLNQVRNNRIDASVLDTLNSRYVAGFQPAEDDAYITLTTHNASAHEINAHRRPALPGRALEFRAGISGDFPTHAYPTDELLELKTGAQVMFVKNDNSREKRYYNGKIGRITRIQEGTIYVRCPDELDTIAVSPVDWDNVKYSLNEQTKEVAEDVIGTFTQYPLKLAWAITIHKSQGLTFERVILDAQAAFAHGQVYVALSRCKSFEGIVLRSRIGSSSVRTDSTVQNFSEAADKNAPDEAQLEQAKRAYQHNLILELFGFDALKKGFAHLNRVLLEHESALHPDAYQQFHNIVEPAGAQVFSTAEKFRAQLHSFFAQPGLPEANDALQDRIRKAAAWFAEQLKNELAPAIKKVRIVTDNKTVRKAAADTLTQLQREIFVKNATFAAAEQGFSTLAYLRAKTDAELNFQASAAASAPAAGPAAPRTIEHPDLYAALLQWRETAANLLDVDLYDVLPTKTLVQLVQDLPTGMPELKKIKGIGKGKSKAFGAELIGIIRAYCEENDLPTSPLPIPEPPKVDTKTQSFELYKAGKTIDEIAAERGFARSTIEGHLAHFIQLRELDIFTLMKEDDVHTIDAFFRDNDTTLSSDAKAHFGEQYSYGEIKMVLAWMAAGE